jgi:thiamine transporter ThiT
LRLFRAALAVSLTVSALLFFLWSWRWPLVGDASLIHYIGFLIQRGWAPYRQLGDMNMPGSYLIEIAAMRLFGMGDVAWRLFDFTLLTLAAAAFFVVTKTPGAPFVTVSSSRVGSNNQNPGAPSQTASPSEVGSDNRSPGAPSFAFLRRVGSHDRRLAALFASSLFILIHGRDGLAEGGQRDLTMAVLLIAATAFLFVAVRKRSTAAAIAFGLFSGIAATVKPTSLPLTLAQLALALYALRIAGSSNEQRRTKNEQRLLAASASAAYLLAPTLALVFLLHEHALAAFLAGFHGIVPYYASLGHRPFGFVLLHSISPLLPLVLIWLFVLALSPSLRHWARDWERAALLAGVLFGLLNCAIQARGLPYYRYPLLAFLLPLMAIDFARAFDSARILGAPFVTASSSRVGPTIAAKTLAILALAFGGFFLAPQSAILIHRYQWGNTEFITSVQQNLNALGGPSLSGRIQCIDSISGCGNVLYRMRLEPATGVLSDFFLFGAISDQQPPDQIPILRDTRAQFLAAMLAHPPQVIVVTSHLHIDGPDNFQKLARWPAFAQFLDGRYTLQTQWSPTRTARWWSREETPASYRIYVLRPNQPSQ